MNMSQRKNGANRPHAVQKQTGYRPQSTSSLAETARTVIGPVNFFGGVIALRTENRYEAKN